MGFEPPVPQQDTNWEIQVAVQASLALQVLLIFVAPLRRTYSSRLIRFVVWSGYLLADWVADLALGLLLNALGNIGPSSTTTTAAVTISHASPKTGVSGGGGSSSSSPVIFAFWAPFLLLHLGGPDAITAFSIEDNELWRRHLVGLLFELLAAATVFFCSLRGNPLILASVFMFVVGVIKYAERTYALYRASADGLCKSMLRDPYTGLNYAKMMAKYSAKKNAGLPVEINVPDAPPSREPRIGQKLKIGDPVESNAFRLCQTLQCLFADLILSFDECKVSRQFFFGLKDRAGDGAKEAFELIKVELGFIYDVIYTKAAVVHTWLGYVLRLVGSACIVAALVIFFFADKRGFTRLDVAITYELLAGAAVLDFAALVMVLCSDWVRVFFADKRVFSTCCACIKNWRFGRRQQRLKDFSGMSLSGYCLDEPVEGASWVPKWAASRRVRRLAGKVGLKECLDGMLFVRREKATDEMKKFIFTQLMEAASERSGADWSSKIEVLEGRGVGALKKLRLADNSELEKHRGELMKSVVKVGFDQSLLQWHIATELCNNDHEEQQPEEIEKQRRISVALSEHLMYLLVMRPVMLPMAAGLRLLSYRDTCAEARLFFAMGEWQPLTKEQKRERLLNVNTDQPPVVVKGDRSKSVLFDACILAKHLQAFGERKWEVMSAVWVEMLAYTACHCLAREHARQLSRGGELVTVVWLLMEHVGLGRLYQMETNDAPAKLIVDK